MSSSKYDLISHIKDVIRLAGGNKAVAERGDIPISTLTTWLGGISEPKVSGLLKLCDATGTSPNELLGWEDAPDRHVVEAMPEGLVRLQMINSAGFEGERAVSFPVKSLQRMGVKPASTVGLMAAGDSMSPTISDGCLVLIDTSRKALEEGIFAFHVDDRSVLRRIAPQMDGGVLLICDAPAYPPERLGSDAASRLNVIGRAIWTEKSL